MEEKPVTPIDWDLIRKTREQLARLRATGLLRPKGYDLATPFSRPLRPGRRWRQERRAGFNDD